MEILLKENLDLKRRLVENMQIRNLIDDKHDHVVSQFSILEILLDCAKANAGKKPRGWRFKEVMKELGFLIFSLGGLALYEIFSCKKNLPFPSVATIRRKIYSNEKFTEGHYRITELKAFLLLHECPLVVHISEDATGVNGRIQYDSATNQIVGFPLPLDSNGVPIVGSYPANSAAVIAEYFKKNPSRLVYCIMAAPLKEGAPSFCLSIFGTNNKFVSEDVKKRLAWTKAEVEKEGIRVIGFGSDGDSRLLSSMIANVITDYKLEWPWFKAKKKVEVVYIQDHIHIGTKLKTRLLKPSIILPLGPNYIATKGHIVELLDTVSKDQHELSEVHINPKDKMNYRALQKLSDPKVTALLRSHVPNSEGTATYLDMIREILESYTRPDLTPCMRIKMIWKWVFFLRLWRSFIEKSNGDYTVTNNFVTSNAYACIELNAHCLIQFIINLREKEEHSSFLPWKLSSQDCEKIFRILRSTLAAHCGATTFSIFDLENHFRRLDLLSSTYVNLSKVISFPRHHKAAHASQVTPHIPVSLPEDFEIANAVSEALQEAVNLAKRFKMLPKGWSKTAVPLTHLQGQNDQETSDSEDVEIDSDIIDIDDEDVEQPLSSEAEVEQVDIQFDIEEDLFMVSSGALTVKTFDVPVSNSSPFVLVSDGFKNPAIIRKSTLCWLLSTGDTRMSSDQLARVQAAPVTHTPLLRTITNKPHPPTVEEVVHVGDWCGFVEKNSIAIGRVLAFSYMTGSSSKNQQYSRLSAPVKAPDSNARGLGCLCSWFFTKGNSRTLHESPMEVHGYYNIETYICTLPRPTFQNGQLFLSCTPKEIMSLKGKKA